MSKGRAISAIRKYGKEYTDTINRINKIRNDTNLSEQGKAVRIAEIASAYNSKADALRNDVIDSIGEVVAGINTRRQSAVKQGLASAEQINMIVNGINNGAYSKRMLDDIIETFSDNPIATESIRGALLKHDDERYKSRAIAIRTYNPEKEISNLEKIADQIQHEPSVLSTGKGDDWNIGLYQSGQTFEAWENYINDNVDE